MARERIPHDPEQNPFRDEEAVENPLEERLTADSVEVRKKGLAEVQQLAESEPERATRYLDAVVDCLAWNPDNPEALTRAEAGTQVAFQEHELTEKTIRTLRAVVGNAESGIEVEPILTGVARELGPETPGLHQPLVSLLLKLVQIRVPDSPALESIASLLLTIIEEDGENGVSEKVLGQAALVLMQIADRRPDSFEGRVSNLDILRDADDTKVLQIYIELLGNLTTSIPGEVLHVLDQQTLDEWLGASDDQVKAKTARLVGRLGNDHVDQVLSLTPGLLGLLSEGRTEVQDSAISALGTIATQREGPRGLILENLADVVSSRPDETLIVGSIATTFKFVANPAPNTLTNHSETILTFFDVDDRAINDIACSIVLKIAEADARQIEFAIEDLVTVVGTTRQNGARIAAKALALYAEVNREPLSEAVELARSKLSSDDAVETVSGVFALAGVAAHEPSAIVEFQPDLLDAIEEDDPRGSVFAFLAIYRSQAAVDGPDGTSAGGSSFPLLSTYWHDISSQVNLLAEDYPQLLLVIGEELLEIAIQVDEDTLPPLLNRLTEVVRDSPTEQANLITGLESVLHSTAATDTKVIINTVQLAHFVSLNFPDDVQPLIDALCDLLVDSSPPAQASILQFFAQLDSESMNRVIPHLDSIVALLSSEPTRSQPALLVLHAISQHHPTALHPYLDTVKDLVRASQADTLHIALEILLNVIHEDVTQTEPAVELLTRVLLSEPRDRIATSNPEAEAFKNQYPLMAEPVFNLLGAQVEAGLDEAVVDDWANQYISYFKEQTDQDDLAEAVMGLWVALGKLSKFARAAPEPDQ